MSFHILVIFWGHSMKKPKKTLRKPKKTKKVKKKNKKKQYFQTLLGSLHEKTKKTLRKPKKKKQYLAILWGGALEIVSK